MSERHGSLSGLRPIISRTGFIDAGLAHAVEHRRQNGGHDEVEDHRMSAV